MEKQALGGALDSHGVARWVQRLCGGYGFLQSEVIGYSIFGREIPCLRLGKGEKKVLYVAAHHGMEGITASVLLRFAEEYCHCYRAGGYACGVSVDYLYETRSIYLIPLLNPDGVDLSVHRMAPQGPLQGRLIAMNGGSSDFSRWQANGRGVDLNHNYNAGFAGYKVLERQQTILPGPTRYSGEGPESEPEVRAVTNLIRGLDGVGLLITLHTQGEEIYWSYRGHAAPGAEAIARKLSQMTGYCLAEAAGLSGYGGMKDWFIEEYNRPAYTFECGKGVNPLPPTELPVLYATLRQALFCAAMMI